MVGGNALLEQDANVMLNPKEYLRRFTSESVRPDSRPLHAARPTTILTGVLPRNAAGSSLVRIGDTTAVAAATLLVGHPGPGTPGDGDVEVRLTMGPLCHPGMNAAGRSLMGEDGRPRVPTDPSAVESWVQRVVRTSGVIDVGDLGIERGKSAWRVRIGVVLLNHDGNIEDAVLLASVAALSDLRLPGTAVSRDGVVSTLRGEGTAVPLRVVPVPLTFALFDGKMLVDPTGQEEIVCDGGGVTVVADTKGRILSLDKRGKAAVGGEDIAACVQMAFGRAKELETLLLRGQQPS